MNNNQTNIEPTVINNPFANMNANKNNNKESKKYKIIIIICSIVIFILFILLLVPKKPKQNTEIKQKENLNEVSLELKDYVSNYNLDSLDLYGKGSYIRVAISDICYGVISCNEIDGTEITNYIKNIFNKEITLEDIPCENNDGPLYSYNQKENKFIYNSNHGAHSLQYRKPILTKINKIRKKEGNYILTLNKLYFNSLRSEYITTDPLGINPIYKFEDYDMPDNNSGQTIDMTKLTTDYENNFEKIKNKGTQYQYTFEKKGTSYILKKYEILGNTNSRY